jgi:hypothetical protein
MSLHTLSKALLLLVVVLAVWEAHTVRRQVAQVVIARL